MKIAVGIRELGMAEGIVKFGAQREPALVANLSETLSKQRNPRSLMRLFEPVTEGIVMQDAGLE